MTLYGISHSSSSEGGSLEGTLDDEPEVSYFTTDSGITEDEPATLEEGLLYIVKVWLQNSN